MSFDRFSERRVIAFEKKGATAVIALFFTLAISMGESRAEELPDGFVTGNPTAHAQHIMSLVDRCVRNTARRFLKSGLRNPFRFFDSLYVLAASKASELARRPAIRRWLDGCAGALLIGSSVGIALARRT